MINNSLSSTLFIQAFKILTTKIHHIFHPISGIFDHASSNIFHFLIKNIISMSSSRHSFIDNIFNNFIHWRWFLKPSQPPTIFRTCKIFYFITASSLNSNFRCTFIRPLMLKKSIHNHIHKMITSRKTQTLIIFQSRQRWLFIKKFNRLNIC